MGHSIRIMLICATLGGCASAGSLPSLSSLSGPDEPQKPANASTAPQTAASQESSSGLSGIWSNFSAAFSSGAQPVSHQTEGEPAIAALDTNEALRLINDYRSKKGLRSLSLDARASAAAQVLAKDMAKHDRMSHTGPNGQDIGQRLAAAGYSYRLAAENVGVGQISLAEMIDGWKKSPPHSRNMLLPDAKNIGIAYEYKPDTKYKTFWTLVVAAP
ncbi:MAG: CAP domain-containing protein [Rhodomicrobium sp.]|nr:CAP domain-containing protein [Rhodomicrobium sp.]